MGRGLRLQDRPIPPLSLFVDTSVWSLALRRDRPEITPELAELRRSLRSRQPVFTTGLVLQELLQGFRGPRARDAIIDRFAALPLLRPERQDHIGAADLRNDCRRRGVQVGTIDALLAQLCIRFELTMLTTDADFARIAEHHELNLWRN
jgi:predicted nucleic acid-binding protein